MKYLLPVADDVDVLLRSPLLSLCLFYVPAGDEVASGYRKAFLFRSLRHWSLSGLHILKAGSARNSHSYPAAIPEV